MSSPRTAAAKIAGKPAGKTSKTAHRTAPKAAPRAKPPTRPACRKRHRFGGACAGGHHAKADPTASRRDATRLAADIGKARPR